MFYKIYFWFYLAFTGLMVLFLMNPVNIWLVVIILSQLILLTALFSNAYKKDFFSATFWKISFMYSILVGIISILFFNANCIIYFKSISGLTIGLIVFLIITTLINIPAYISLYVYVFKRRKVSFKFKINKQKLWKIYFWFLLLISMGFPWTQDFTRSWDIIDFVISAIIILGLYAFCWNKKILSSIFWKIFFAVSIVWNIIFTYLVPISPKLAKKLAEKGSTIAQPPRYLFSTIGLILLLPLFYALYLYAFKSEGIWEKEVSEKK